jgi:creatinine amidohydrolase
MRYEMMFAKEIRQAIDENWPVSIALGPLEYHAEHCVTGVDTLLVVRALEALEQEMNLVILPPFYYAAASYVVAPPERNGSIQIDSDILHLFGRDLFRSLLRIGFRNIHGFIHHQSENFTAGMPTDLAFKLAARQATFEFLDKERGEGWWGSEEMSAYYENVDAENPFNWIQIHPFMDEQAQKQFPIDHAGRQETSLMLAFCPEGVNMNRLSEEMWFSRSARQASEQEGNKARELILTGMRRALGKD